MKDEFLKQIKNCQLTLEAEYNKIGENYGALRQDLDQKLADNKEILTQSRSRLQSSQKSGISGIINALEESSKKMEKGVGLLTDELHTHLGQLQENLEQLKKTDELILEIRDYSEVMELIALNAMVVAIKAGKNGGGFTYITDVLKKNASSTLFLTDEVIDLGNTIQSEFSSVENISTELDELKKSMEIYQNKIGADFRLYHNAVDNFSNFLADMEKKILELKSPLLEIMETLQYQDIIRQSIDHIRMMLNDVPANSDFYEDRLNYLSFFELIINFSIPLIGEKRKDIERNITLFETNTSTIRENLIHLDTLKQEYLENQRTKTIEEGSLLDGLTQMSRDFNALQSQLYAVQKKLNFLSSNMGNISGSVRSLKEKNSRFERLIKLFRNITLMGRIEVTKHIALQDVELSVDSIADVTDQIESSVEKINSFTENVLLKNDSIGAEFFRLQEMNRQFLDEYKTHSAELGTGMQDLEIMFERSLGALDLYSPGIQKTFFDCLESFTGLGNAVNCLNRTVNELSSFREKVLIEKNECLKKNNIKEWKLNDKKMKKMLNDFTIHDQKQIVSHLSGAKSSDEPGVELGSVTLF